MNVRRIAVIGAGAVGAYYGGRLTQAGHVVDFFSRSDAGVLRSHGLRVRSVDGDFTIASPGVFDDVAGMPPADVVIVALKATARADYVRLVRPVLHDGSIIVCLQNGLGNEEVFASAFGDNRVLGGIAYTCINRVGAGEIVHTAEGRVRVGPYGRAGLDAAESVAGMMRDANIQAEAVADLHFFRWQKLAWNIPFNGWGAALDRHTAELLATPGGGALIRDTMAEVLSAARSVGVDLGGDALIDDQIARTHRMGEYHSSMQLDRQAGRAMEIDAVVAEPLRQAKAAGCGPLPMIEVMLRCLQAVSDS